MYDLLPPLAMVDVPGGEIVPPEPAEEEMLKDPTAPDWVTVKTCPPTARVAVLDVLPVLAATLKASEPAPLPLAVVSVIQEVPVVAVHAQPAVVVTATVLPLEALAALGGFEILVKHRQRKIPQRNHGDFGPRGTRAICYGGSEFLVERIAAQAAAE